MPFTAAEQVLPSTHLLLWTAHLLTTVRKEVHICHILTIETKREIIFCSHRCHFLAFFLIIKMHIQFLIQRCNHNQNVGGAIFFDTRPRNFDEIDTVTHNGNNFMNNNPDNIDFLFG